MTPVAYAPGGSRLVVRPCHDSSGTAVRVDETVYERRLDECAWLTELTVHPAGNQSAGGVGPVDISDAAVQWPGLRLASTGRTLALLADGDVTVQLRPAGDVVDYSWTGPSGREIRVLADAAVTMSRASGGKLRLEVPAGHGILVTADPNPPEPAHVVEQVAARTAAWQARRPRADQFSDVVAAAWTTLGRNVIRLDSHPERDVLIPSRYGYVGVWQWDSYLMAAGLRHGDPALAADQIALFLDQQRPDGLIPDVIFDDGTLARVGDLPSGERAAAARMIGRSADDPSIDDVPVTKPPLAAWAAELVRRAGGPDLLTTRRNQFDALRSWWLGRPSMDGLPGIEHPYSSGLDDSPLYDSGCPVFAPDIGSYLVVEADVLAAADLRAGRSDELSRRRAEKLTAALLDRWNALGYAESYGPDGQRLPVTPLGLLPLLTGRLPEDATRAAAGLLTDPRFFGTTARIPTVAAGEPSFDPNRMWRGPVWVNINWLIVQGLRQSGLRAEADRLAEHTLELLREAGGFPEYLRPDTGTAADRAVGEFGWSAALAIDLAMGLQPDRDPGPAR